MKTKLLFILAFTLLFTNQTNAQSLALDWAKSMGGTINDLGYSITIDVDNNMYIIGVFFDTVDFDPGPGVSNLISNGHYDIFIQKLDSSGNLLWVKSIGGVNDDYSYSITSDVVGNVYLTGSFRFTVDFDPNNGVANLTTNGSSDIFVLKLNSSGNMIWAKSMVGSGTDVGRSITSDASCNIYLTGYFQNTVDFDTNSGVAYLSCNGGHNMFMQKLDSAGSLIWAKSIEADVGESITTDSYGNIYITGEFRDTVDFDPGSGITSKISNGGKDIFVQKLDTSGNLLWVKSIGGTNFDESHSITTDTLDNIYITGYFQDTVDFDPNNSVYNLTSNGVQDIFIQKLNVAGNLLWAKSIGGNGGDVGHSICSDLVGNIYIMGYFQDTVDFDPGPGITKLIFNGYGFDLFVQKLDSSGNLLWVKSILVKATYDYNSSITCDNTGNIYMTGSYRTTVDFDPGSSVFSLNSNGETDVFVLKLKPCTSTSGSETITACNSFKWSANSNTYSSSGTFTTILSNAANCDSIITLNLTIISVNDSVTQSGTTLTSNETGATYQWLDCNNNYSIISGATNQSYTATANGNYAVEITKNGCVDTSICYSINIGIIENSFGDEFNFFPNPTSGKVNLELGANYKDVQIKIRNSEGKLIKQQQFKNKQKISLEIEGSKGIYLLEIISGDERAVVKVVKQ